MYGDPLSAETYEGPRDYETMSAFAKEHISKLQCSVFKQENCNEAEMKIIKDLESQSDENLLETADKVNKLVMLQESLFDEEVEDIQKKYDALVEKFNGELEKVKGKFNYNFLEQILNIRGISEEAEGELMEEEAEL